MYASPRTSTVCVTAGRRVTLPKSWGCGEPLMRHWTAVLGCGPAPITAHQSLNTFLGFFLWCWASNRTSACQETLSHLAYPAVTSFKTNGNITNKNVTKVENKRRYRAVRQEGWTAHGSPYTWISPQSSRWEKRKITMLASSTAGPSSLNRLALWYSCSGLGTTPDFQSWRRAWGCDVLSQLRKVTA